LLSPSLFPFHFLSYLALAYSTYAKLSGIICGTYSTICGLICGTYTAICALIRGTFLAICALICGTFPAICALICGTFPAICALICGTHLCPNMRPLPCHFWHNIRHLPHHSWRNMKCLTCHPSGWDEESHDTLSQQAASCSQDLTKGMFGITNNTLPHNQCKKRGCDIMQSKMSLTETWVHNSSGYTKQNISQYS